MVDQGLLSREEAHRHPQKNVIYKTLGVNRDDELDLLGPIPVSFDDIFVLCSDGLINHVTDEEILKVASQESPQSACENLIHLANQRGGLDNITIQILKMKKPGHQPLSLGDRKKFWLIIGLILLILLVLNGLILIDPEFLKKIPFLSLNKP